ncbi:MAG: hybrid sensor histidine kinase/response regulator [Acidobacteriota bacterium]
MSSDFSPATLMIVDDEPENLNVLGDMLRAEGWTVLAFPDGEMALAAASEEAPDLVLLDINMPGLDGFDVCRRLKALDSPGPIPVIFLSAFSDSAAKVRAFGAGGVDYVTKPFAEVEVLARVHLQLRLRKHQFHLEALVQQRMAELAEAHRRLRIWDDAKTQWLEMLSHEMRTPLQGMFGVAELLFADVPKTVDSAPLLDSYSRSRARIVKLVDDAVALTSIDVGAKTFVPSPERLTPLLREAVHATTLAAPEVPIRAALAAADGVVVSCAPGLLGRAFSDLLLTATRCVRDGEPVTVEVDVVDGWARISIATGGKSLSAEALDTFFAVGGQRTLLKGGGDYGLGPALASRIVELFNGRISVRNGAELGIVIEMQLPTDELLPTFVATSRD